MNTNIFDAVRGPVVHSGEPQVLVINAADSRAEKATLSLTGTGTDTDNDAKQLCCREGRVSGMNYHVG